jgi:uncharacterized protein YpmS
MNDILLNNWKWIVGTLIALTGLVIAYLNYRKKSSPANKQKGGKDSINVQSSKNVKISKK